MNKENEIKVMLMRTVFKRGLTEVIEDMLICNLQDTMRRAFQAQRKLNRTRSNGEFYWVKCVNC